SPHQRFSLLGSFEKFRSSAFAFSIIDKTKVPLLLRLAFWTLNRLKKFVMNKYITEFIGTFFLVLTIGCTGIGAGAGVIAPLAIGAALMVMVFAGGHISGAHYNPAVTVGMLIRGKLNPADVVPYWIAQFVAAALAAVIVIKCLRAGAPVTPITPHIGPALLAEFLFTFTLVYFVTNTAAAERRSGHSIFSRGTRRPHSSVLF